MLLIILSWIYISFIFFSLGLCVQAMVQRIIHKNNQPVLKAPSVVIVLLQGMVATAVFASLLSFIMPLSAWANLLMLSMSIACMAIFKKERAAVVARCRSDCRFTTRLLRIIFLFFVVVVAYLASQVSSHYDDGLYYATTIKWIEEYGTVKGLANVNPRIGFNSTWLLLQALFSFHYLRLGNFNDLNGLLLLYVLMYSLGALNSLFLRDYSISTIVRALLVLPLAAFHFGASNDFILFNV